MKKAAIAFAAVVGLLLGGGASHTVSASSAFSENKRVSVSTSTVTLISAAGNYQRTLLINTSTDYCLFGDNRTSFSTSSSTGTARISDASFSPDGPKEPYQGAIYGLCSGAAAVVIDVIRIK